MTDVVCALIVNNGKILIVQHGALSKHHGKWEFPGGKVHPGEFPESALIREIREELDIDVEVIFPLEAVVYPYPGKTIRLIPYVCAILSGSIFLNEHCQLHWSDIPGILGADLLPADLALMEIKENYLKLLEFTSEGEGL